MADRAEEQALEPAMPLDPTASRSAPRDSSMRTCAGCPKSTMRSTSAAAGSPSASTARSNAARDLSSNSVGSSPGAVRAESARRPVGHRGDVDGHHRPHPGAAQFGLFHGEIQRFLGASDPSTPTTIVATASFVVES
jgi:hypothetical protein